jgi:hypothetical protein
MYAGMTIINSKPLLWILGGSEVKDISTFFMKMSFSLCINNYTGMRFTKEILYHLVLQGKGLCHM